VCFLLVSELIKDIIENRFGMGFENGTENMVFADVAHLAKIVNPIKDILKKIKIK